jgi:DNA repair protein RadC
MSLFLVLMTQEQAITTQPQTTSESLKTTRQRKATYDPVPFEQLSLFPTDETATTLRDSLSALPSIVTAVPSIAASVPDMASLIPNTTKKMAQYYPVLGIKLVRLDTLTYRGNEKMKSPRAISDLLSYLYKGADREIFTAVLLSTKNDVIGVSIVSVGNLSSALVHPREVLKPAILANAASIIIAHNHPSGDTTPSVEDVEITQRLSEACRTMGIELLDHVILGDTGFFRSLKEGGFF